MAFTVSRRTTLAPEAAWSALTDLAEHIVRCTAAGLQAGFHAIGDAALGLVTAFHYSEAHNSPENKAYVDAFMKANNGLRPNFMSVGGYDGMHVIYEALTGVNLRLGATRGDLHLAL